MSWEDIIKVSPLEREIAEEYAPDEMEDFNEIGKLIQLMKDSPMKLINNAADIIHQQGESGYYDQFENGKEAYEDAIDMNEKLHGMFYGYIKDLKALRKQGRSHERDKVEPKGNYEERSQQRQEVFGSSIPSR